MANQNFTSEDYLDSLLNSIMKDEKSSSDGMDLDTDFSDIKDEDVNIDEELGNEFFDDIEADFLSESDKSDIKLIDEDEDYFGKEITNEELFDLDDDILSAIGEEKNENNIEKPENNNENRNETEEKVEIEDNGNIKEVFKDIQEESVDEAINSNDSAVNDDLQGLFDIMGIENNDVGDYEPDSLKTEKKKGLFGKKKDKQDKKSKKKLKEDKKENQQKESEEEAINGELNFQSSTSDESIDIINLENPGVVEADNAVSDEKALFDELGLDFGVMSPGDENLSDIKEFETESNTENLFGSSYNDGEDEEEEDSGKKKKKGKKPKKEKKEKKKKKEKKPKAPKKIKEKKVKEKEPDEYIKISKGFIIISCSLIFVLIFTIVFGGDYYTYNKKISEATNYYVNQNYDKAYEQIFGLKMKKNDHKEFYSQVETIMYVNRHYDAYQSLIKMDEYEQGLYSLLKGVKMFDKYQNQGRELNCYDDMQNVLGWIDKGLLETYGLTESQAREMNLISDEEEYAEMVYRIADEARQRIKAEKEAEEEAQKNKDETSEGVN